MERHEQRKEVWGKAREKRKGWEEKKIGREEMRWEEKSLRQEKR